LKNKKKKLFCAFVDFEKAFGTVWRDALWYEMLLNNINGLMYQVILICIRISDLVYFIMEINVNIFHVK
jgi:hypothetical protein